MVWRGTGVANFVEYFGCGFGNGLGDDEYAGNRTLLYSNSRGCSSLGSHLLGRCGWGGLRRTVVVIHVHRSLRKGSQYGFEKLSAGTYFGASDFNFVFRVWYDCRSFLTKGG